MLNVCVLNGNPHSLQTFSLNRNFVKLDPFMTNEARWSGWRIQIGNVFTEQIAHEKKVSRFPHMPTWIYSSPFAQIYYTHYRSVIICKYNEWIYVGQVNLRKQSINGKSCGRRFARVRWRCESQRGDGHETFSDSNSCSTTRSI